jgi:hypothetical protein
VILAADRCTLICNRFPSSCFFCSDLRGLVQSQHGSIFPPEGNVVFNEISLWSRKNARGQLQYMLMSGEMLLNLDSYLMVSVQDCGINPVLKPETSLPRQAPLRRCRPVFSSIHRLCRPCQGGEINVWRSLSICGPLIYSINAVM